MTMPCRLRLLHAVGCLLVLGGGQALAFGSSPPGFYNDSKDALPASMIRVAKHSPDDPVTLSAQELAYDQENAIVIARGDVEVLQGMYVLTADQITYYQNKDLVVAQGNVTMLQPNGDVYFAERATLRDQMKTGVVEAFKVRMADNSVFVANEARKVSPSITKLSDASYTPCNLCEDMAPFWQLNAEKVKVDEGEERVIYHNATMEMFGQPVLYTPYLAHPTPDAAGKSGFQVPEYSNSDNLGTTLKVPYYWRIGEDRDAIITPWYTTTEGLLIQEDYHQLTEHGDYLISGSATYPKRLDVNGNETNGHEFRGHIYAIGEEGLTPYSRVGFDINRASDDTYLRRYGFGSQRTLFSRAYAEAAQNRNFALLQGLSIQGLRVTDSPKITPLVLPMLQGYYETMANDFGLSFHVAGDAQALSRDVGIDQQRLSTTLGATLPYVTDGGHIFTSTLNLRQDIYHSSNVPINGGANQFDGVTGRTLPQAALEWRYPLIRQFGDDTMTVEPIMLGVLQTLGGNPQEISNEDDTLIELTDTNIFSIDRMPGLDLVDSGSRVAYGFRSQYLFREGTAIDALLGQSYNLNDTPFPNSTRPGENFSDYIGRVAFNYAPLNFAYRFALDKDALSSNRNEIMIGFSKPWLSINTSYRSLDNNRYLSNSEEGTVSAMVPFSDQWSIYGSATRDLDSDQMVAAGAGVIYKNECFNLMVDGLRTYTRDRDVEPNTQVTLRVGFKNLGEFGGK